MDGWRHLRVIGYARRLWGGLASANGASSFWSRSRPVLFEGDSHLRPQAHLDRKVRAWICDPVPMVMDRVSAHWAADVLHGMGPVTPRAFQRNEPARGALLPCASAILHVMVSCTKAAAGLLPIGSVAMTPTISPLIVVVESRLQLS